LEIIAIPPEETAFMIFYQSHLPFFIVIIVSHITLHYIHFWSIIRARDQRRRAHDGAGF
jgi:hypothetical protein